MHAASFPVHTDATEAQPTAPEPPLLNIEKLLRELQAGGNAPKDYRKRVLVKQGQKLLSVETSDILYFYTDERFSFF